MNKIALIIPVILLAGCVIKQPEEKVIERIKYIPSDINCPKCEVKKCPKYSPLEIFELPYEVVYPSVDINYEDEKVVILERSEYEKLINSSITIFDTLTKANNQSREFNRKLSGGKARNVVVSKDVSSKDNEDNKDVKNNSKSKKTSK